MITINGCMSHIISSRRLTNGIDLYEQSTHINPLILRQCLVIHQLSITDVINVNTILTHNII